MNSTLSETAEPTTEAPHDKESLNKESRNGDAPISHPVLIVDDKEENRFSFRKSLSAAGFEVEEAADGMAALQYLLKNSASLVLLDVQMPGMNGFEVAQAIRQAPQHVDLPILFITATYRSDDFINYGYSVGAYDYLTKPVDSRLLVNKVKLFHTLYEQQRALQHANQKMVILNASLQQGRTALQQEKHYMERVLDSMSEALLVVEPDTTIRDCNPALLRLTGLQRKALLGRPFGTLFAEEEEEVFDKLLSLFQGRLQRIHDRDHDAFHQLLLEAPVPVVVLNLDRELETVAPIFIISHEMEQQLGHPQGELAGRSVLELLPEREQQRLQQRMEQSRHTLECAEEQRCNWLHAEGYEVESRVCMIHIDCSGRNHIVVQLQTAQSLAPELLAMTTFGKVFAEEEEEEEEVSVDRMLVNAAGTQIPVAINGALLHNPDGEGRGAVLVVHDLRERRRSEELDQYAAFQSGVAEMSANILHNVGNTIQGMDAGEGELLDRLQDLQRIHGLYEGFCSQLKAAEAGGDAQVLEEARERMIAAGLKLPDALHSGVIEPSRVQMKSLSVGISHIKEVIRAQQKGVEIDTHAVRFQLPALLEDLRLLTEGEVDKRSIVVEEEVVQPMPELRLPRNQLLQALINLIKNSAESIEERIFVQQQQQKEAGHAAPAEDGKIRISAQTEKKMLLLEVSDNGNGFEPELAQELVRFGYTTKMDASGFGLHATGNFVNSIGGSLQLESDGVGKGATARIRLPLTSTDG